MSPTVLLVVTIVLSLSAIAALIVARIPNDSHRQPEDDDAQRDRGG